MLVRPQLADEARALRTEVDYLRIVDDARAQRRHVSFACKHYGGEQLKLRLDEVKAEEPISGLPERRKRPHAFGTPSIEEFQAAIAKHQTRGEARQRVRTDSNRRPPD